MPVSMEQFKEALSKLENGEDLLEFHASSVSAEKNLGISKHKEANKEAQGLRKFKLAFEKLGYDPESKIDIDEFADGLLGKVTETTNKATGEIGELQKKLNKLTKDFTTTQDELKAEREQRSTLEKVNRAKTIESKLLPKLKEDFYGAEYMIKALLVDGAVDLDDAGEVVFKKGDSVVSLTDGLKQIAESNADARRNKQTGGAGSSTSVQPNRPKFTIDQIKAMDPKTMQANIANVNESMRQISDAAK